MRVIAGNELFAKTFDTDACEMVLATLRTSPPLAKAARSGAPGQKVNYPTQAKTGLEWGTPVDCGKAGSSPLLRAGSE
jgi:hypothetical protein